MKEENTNFFNYTRWHFYLLLFSFSLFCVAFDVFSMAHIPIEISNSEAPRLYGFPFANKTNLSWHHDGSRTLYIIPYILDVIVYFVIFFILNQLIQSQLIKTSFSKKIIIPIIIGILFISIIPFLIPDYNIEWGFVDFPSATFDLKFNGYGNR